VLHSHVQVVERDVGVAGSRRQRPGRSGHLIEVEIGGAIGGEPRESNKEVGLDG
jgi:hypothetical protein